MSLRINLVEQNPSILEKLYHLGQMLIQPGWHGYVLTELKKIAIGDLHLLSESDQAQAKTQYYYLLGICSQGVARYADAISHFYRVPGWNSNVDVLKKLYECHKSLGKLDMAMEMKGKIDDIHFTAQGNQYFQSRDFTNAVYEFMQVRDWFNNEWIYQKILFAGHYTPLSKTVANLMLHKVELALEEKKHDKVRFLLRELAACFPDDFNICFLQCKFLKEIKAPEARDIHEFAFQRWQNHPGKFKQLQVLIFGAVFDRDYTELQWPIPRRPNEISQNGRHAILSSEWNDDVVPANVVDKDNLNGVETNPKDHSYSTLGRKC